MSKMLSVVSNKVRQTAEVEYINCSAFPLLKYQSLSQLQFRKYLCDRIYLSANTLVFSHNLSVLYAVFKRFCPAVSRNYTSVSHHIADSGASARTRTHYLCHQN